jgi:PAS domain-containing protein
MKLSHADILEFFPEGVFLINTRWQIEFFNKMAEEITGFSREEVIGKFCWDIFRADQCQRDCPMRISMSTGEILVDREVEITTATRAPVKSWWPGPCTTTALGARDLLSPSIAPPSRRIWWNQSYSGMREEPLPGR